MRLCTESIAKGAEFVDSVATFGQPLAIYASTRVCLTLLAQRESVAFGHRGVCLWEGDGRSDG